MWTFSSCSGGSSLIAWTFSSCSGGSSLRGLSLVAVGVLSDCVDLLWLQWGSSLIVVCGLLVAVASHCRTQALGHVGSVAVARGLSCSMACGIFQDQGLNLCSLHWQVDS